MSQIGQILASRYRLLDQLGQGGMGTVWRAEHVALGSKVAVKLIEPAIATTPDALERFYREAKAAAALACPHVVQIYDYGVDDGIPYIAMELLDGESLGDRLERTRTMSPAETLRVLTHACIALAKAHAAGVVHRDIKPDNIFLTQGYDGLLLAKILDFGVAKDISGVASISSHTRTGSMIGSPYYMSPEQIQNTKSVDYRTDLWAIGIIAFECLTGQKPFNSDSLGGLLVQICTGILPVPSLIASVPIGFDDWFAKACTNNAAARFQNAQEMVEGLRLVVAGEPTSFQPVPSNRSTVVLDSSSSPGIPSQGVVSGYTQVGPGGAATAVSTGSGGRAATG